MNIKKSMNELEAYFQQEGSTPEVINNNIKRAALLIATMCAHPADITTEDLEQIALPLSNLSEIIDIIDKYEDKAE